MLVSDFITRVNYALRGIDDDAPSESTEEWNYWVDTLNLVKDNLFRNSGVNWSFSHKTIVPNEPGTVATAAGTTLTGTGTNFTDYSAGDTVTVSGETVRTIASITSDTSLEVTAAFDNTDSALTFTHATIIAAADSRYNLHRSFLNPSRDPFVTKTDGNNTYYDVIHPEEASKNTRNVYLEGENPQTLVFTDTIASGENIVGGTLYVPGYFMPDDVSANTDIVPLPDPNWGVYAVASEIAFNDITYEDKAPDLNAKANNLYSQMVKKNRKGTYNNPRVTPRRPLKIRSY